MVPQLASVAGDYGVAVLSGGGFESVTEKHRLAVELSNHSEPVEVLHVGDHDPSGTHLFLALAEDVEAFGDGYGLAITFTRLAVTPEQITALALPTAPAKESDDRAFEGATCQAEAIAPDVLAGILQDAIDERLDRGAYDEVLARELEIKAELVQKLV
jgi:hypothetical protein